MPALLLALVFTGVIARTVAAQPVNSVAVHLIRRCQFVPDCLRAGTVRQMTDETSRIWSSLDVRIDWIDPADAEAPAGQVDLTVLLEESAAPGLGWPLHRGRPLAAIHPPDVPCGPALARVWVTQARRHASSIRVHAIPFGSLPDTLAGRFLARSLGRALAHEIGHYLLPTAGHARRGLMRAWFAPLELLEPVTEAQYGLEHHDREALRVCRAGQDVPVATSR